VNCGPVSVGCSIAYELSTPLSFNALDEGDVCSVFGAHQTLNMGGVQLRRRLLARGNFCLLPAGDGLLLPGDDSRQMQRLPATLPHEYSC